MIKPFIDLGGEAIQLLTTALGRLLLGVDESNPAAQASRISQIVIAGSNFSLLVRYMFVWLCQLQKRSRRRNLPISRRRSPRQGLVSASPNRCRAAPPPQEPL